SSRGSGRRHLRARSARALLRASSLERPCLEEVSLELHRAVVRRMARKDRLSTASPDRAPLVIRKLAQITQDVLGSLGDEDLVARDEEAVEPLPPIGDDRRAASRGLEESNAGSPAHSDHLLARQVERETLLVVEGTVWRRRKVLDALDVRRPVHVGRIERARHDEASRRPLLRNIDEQPVERGLPVDAIGAHVAEVIAERTLERPMELRVGATVE